MKFKIGQTVYYPALINGGYYVCYATIDSFVGDMYREDYRLRQGGRSFVMNEYCLCATYDAAKIECDPR